MYRNRIRRRRIVNFYPSVTYFKPQGIPMSELEEVLVSKEELETIRLYSLEEMEQEEVASNMGISQPTVARAIKQVYKKIAEALINGKAIRIEND